ncbi:MAG: hypothetical protein FJZ01_10840 [Candidatus Sericytochromatia bacterium]|nr:hypothetical protein [Candidatus Tanganyikabacteria bacterium]
MAQYLARQKRLADQYAGNPDAELEDFKKLMGKFSGNGVAVGDSVAKPTPAATDRYPATTNPTPSSIGLEPAAPTAPAPASPASPEPVKAADQPAPPPPPKKKKKKKKNCLKKTFDFIGKVVKVAVPAVVGFFTGGPVGAALGAVNGVSNVIAEEKQKKAAAAA